MGRILPLHAFAVAQSDDCSLFEGLLAAREGGLGFGKVEGFLKILDVCLWSFLSVSNCLCCLSWSISVTKDLFVSIYVYSCLSLCYTIFKSRFVAHRPPKSSVISSQYNGPILDL